jgi:hypothetical protein
MARKENNQDRDTHKREFAQQLLDSYFTFRENLPREGFFQENKTTLQIRDDLTPMMMLSTEDVVRYMLDHDYHPTTEQDGTVAWAIWRQA